MLSESPQIDEKAKAEMTPMEQRLARRIHNQRRRLAQLEKFELDWCRHWRLRALAYRHQLEEAGMKPKGVWSPTYKRPYNGS